MGQLGFFDADKRLEVLSARGDPLEACRGRAFAPRSRRWCSQRTSCSPFILQSWLNIAELLSEFQQSDLGADNLLFSRHGVLQCAGEAPRLPTPTIPPRLGLRFAVRTQDTSVRLCFD